MPGVTVTTAQIKNRVGNLLSDYWEGQKHYSGFSDERFYLPTLDEIQTFVTSPSNRIRRPASFSETFDCDDFSFVFKGNICLFTRDRLNIQHSICVGIVWAKFNWTAGPHACNWVLTSDQTLRWIEPQDQPLHRLSDCRKSSIRFLVA